MLIYYIPGGAITIVYGDRKAVATDSRDGVRQRLMTRKVRRLLRREIIPRYRNLDVRGSQAPPAEIYGRADNGGGPCAVSDGTEAAAMVKSCMMAL